MRIANWLASFWGRKADEGSGMPILNGTAPDRMEASILPVYSQQRRYPRFAVEGMDIRSKMMFAEPIQLSNISVGGACIITKTPLRAGHSILIRMNRDKIKRPILGTIVWNSQGSGVSYAGGVNPQLYRSGIQFKEVRPGTLVQLKDFMRIAGVPEEKAYDKIYTPVALRYTVISDEKAILNYTSVFRVKKISLSGMLVEAIDALEIGRKYPMALFLPHESSPVVFQGRIASQVPGSGEQYGFDLGIEFCNLLEPEKTKLKRFIAGLLWKHEVK
jgi:hypothetical protein